MKNIKWMDRALFVSPFYIALCTTEKAFRKQLRKMGVPERDQSDFVSGNSDATSHFFQNVKGSLCAIVTIRLDKQIERIQIYSLLVHEAVHVWQEIKSTIGERQPSAEFEAYSVQAIAQELMFAYDKLCD